jgi:hypothetical protein
VAEANPLIFEHPKSQTVPLGGSALLGVMAAGPAPFSYQWLKDGLPLSGETAATLSLSELGSAASGEYSVRVRNAFGLSTSDVAILQVSEAAERPRLGPANLPTNAFAFVLTGESNRYYRIESSTNGIHWSAAEYFPKDMSLLTSVVRTTDATAQVVVPKNGSFALFRASVYTPPNELCNNNLRQIRYAKLIWSRQFQRLRSEWANWADLTAYMNVATNSSVPTLGSCPAGGRYTMGHIAWTPSCSATNHVLEER